MTEKAVAKKQEQYVTYQAGGEEVKLSMGIVRNTLNQDTKNLTDQEVYKFIKLCEYRKLNPFLNEAYLVKYGSEKAQMIVGFEAMKRIALTNPRYARHEAGVIVLRDNKIVEEVGAFKLPKDVLVGGWAKVYTKDNSEPIEMKVTMEEYDKHQSTWKKMPLVMIRKVALVQAFREAFPDSCGAMYTSEEMPSKEEQPYKGKSRDEFIKDRLAEVKAQAKEQEPQNIPFSEPVQDAEIVEDEQIDF